jgi:Cytochrome c oxidase subunit IV
MSTPPDASPEAPPTRGVKVQYRVYLGTAAFLIVIGVVYWFASYEDAGTVMLLLSGVLALIIGGWLWIQSRKMSAASQPASEAAEDEWLPHASIWPFWIGLGAAFAAGGLAMSPWLVVPGVIVLVIGVVGWARQSRYRT